MANGAESQSGGEKKGRFLRFYKNFNKVSAVVLASAGIIFKEPVLLGLAAIDVLQSIAVGQFEKWRDRRKAGKQLGGQAIKGALQPA